MVDYRERVEFAEFIERYLLKSEVMLEDIMEKLGHTEDDTTRIIYRHMTKEMKKKASHKFEQLMRSLH